MKIELPQQESTQPTEAAVNDATAARAEPAQGPQRLQFGKFPADSAGVVYRRTFACASSAEEPDEPVKT